MGNVYDSPDRTDRSYGRGGQLREDKKWRYYYDSQGNLVLKTMRRMEPLRNAEARDEFLAWQSGDYAYTWQGNGMLRSVTRPDGKTVTFKYDALGRRIEKVFDGRVYRYLWDGDVILHEWDYAEADRPNTIVTDTGEVTLDRPEPVENLITWVYDSDSYVPTAKIVGDKHYSIVSDYIGHPVQSYDDKGNLVWQAEYDIYGNLRNLHGSRQFIPFRQLGQYEDDETRLYYNRFRYYDPRIGNYISQDPIRLAGNNPTLYGYVRDLNKRTDLFGLSELVYQLLNSDNEVVYYGITSRTADERWLEHLANPEKNGKIAKMQVLAEGLNHDQARSIEGALIRKRLAEHIDDYSATDSIKDQLKKSNLLNKNRGRVKERWTSENPLEELKNKMHKKPKDVGCKL